MTDNNRSQGRSSSRPTGSRGSGPARGASARRDDARPAPRPRSEAAEDLLEMADELEEQGRALLRQAKELQRLATRMGPPDRRPAGPPQGSGGARPGGPRAGGRKRQDSDEPGAGRSAPRRREGADERGPRPEPRRGTGDAPTWAPQGKRRRS